MLTTMHENSPNRPFNQPIGTAFGIDYAIDPSLVADSLIARLERMADERAEYRRALIHAVETIPSEVFESADDDDASVAVQ